MTIQLHGYVMLIGKYKTDWRAFEAIVDMYIKCITCHYEYGVTSTCQ